MSSKAITTTSSKPIAPGKRGNAAKRLTLDRKIRRREIVRVGHR